MEGVLVVMPEVFRCCDAIGWVRLVRAMALIFIKICRQLRRVKEIFAIAFEFQSMIWQFKHELYKRVLLNRDVLQVNTKKSSSLLSFEFQNPLRHIVNSLITLLGRNFRYNSVLILTTLLDKFVADLLGQLAHLNECQRHSTDQETLVVYGWLGQYPNMSKSQIADVDVAGIVSGGSKRHQR